MHALRKLARPIVGLLLLLTFHAACNLYWLSNDNRPDMGDEAQHRIFAETYYRALNADTSLFWRAKYFFKSRTAIYPPLFHAASAVVAFPFGDSTVAFGLLNTLVFLALIVVMYQFGKLYRGAGFGLLVATLTSFTPFLLGLSRLFLTDLLSCLIVGLAMWLLVRTHSFTRTRTVVLFALVNAIGFWVRWITCLYYLVPLAYSVLNGLRTSFGGGEGRHRPLTIAGNCLLTIVIALAVAGPWYFPRVPMFVDTYENHFKKLGAVELLRPGAPSGGALTAGPAPGAPSPLPSIVLNMVLGMAEGGVAPAEEPPGLFTFQKRRVDFRVFSAEIWSTYLLIIINKGLFLPMTTIALAGMVLAWRERRNPVIQYALLWVLGSYVILSLGWYFRSPAPRYAAQMLPALSFFAALALYAIPRRTLRNSAIAMVLVLQLYQFWNQTIGGLGRAGRVELPFALGHHVITNSFDEGVAVVKDAIDGGGAKIGPIFRGVNWAERALDAVVYNELETDYLAWPDARMNLVGLRKAAIESRQRRYGPQMNPLSPKPESSSRYYTGPYFSVLNELKKYGAIKIALENDSSELAAVLDSSLPEIPALGAWTIEFPRSTPIGAFSAWFPHEQAVLELLYWSESDQRYQPVHANPDSVSGPRSFHFRAFESIETDKLLLAVATQQLPSSGVDTTELLLAGSGEAPFVHAAGQLDFYAYREQPRPPVLVENSDALTSPRQVERVDYVLLPHALTRLEKRLLDGFKILDQFRANAWTYWDERDFVLLAREHEPVILLDNTPGLRIRTSGGDLSDGRWDIPWWRFPAVSAPHYGNAEKLYWRAAAPAAIEADLGGAHVIRGLEIVPFSETQGASGVLAEFWDAPSNEWRPVPAAELLGQPKNQVGKPPSQWHAFLPLWEETIMTDRIRITIRAGAPASPSEVYVAQFYLYGESLGER